MPFNYQNYQFKTGVHHDKNVIFVHFTYSMLLKNELKGNSLQLNGVCQSKSKHPAIEQNQKSVRRFMIYFNKCG